MIGTAEDLEDITEEELQDEEYLAQGTCPYCELAGEVRPFHYVNAKNGMIEEIPDRTPCKHYIGSRGARRVERRLDEEPTHHLRTTSEGVYFYWSALH